MIPKLKLSSLQADLALEREGEWQDAPELGAGVAFLVRSTNFPDYATATDTAAMKLARTYGDAPVPAEDNALIMGGLLADHILLGWRGLDEAYSADLARTVLTDESYRVVRISVIRAARKVGRRELEFVKDAEKN